MTNGDEPAGGPDEPPDGAAGAADRSGDSAGDRESREATAGGPGGRADDEGSEPGTARESDGGFGFDRSTYVVLVVAGLLVGALLAPIAVGVTSQTSAGPSVAVVPLAGGIDGGSAARVSAQVERARKTPSVKAVVLRVNSPGGGAAASEGLYLSIKRLAEEKPVVVSVDAIATSGAYYASLPANEIYAKPTSQVGSVGVLAPIPPEVEPNDIIAATGPQKVGRSSEREFKYKVETSKRSFANAVMKHREDELNISRSTVTEAGVYSGVVAVRNGMADEIGGIRTATARAAELAGLDQYSVAVYSPNGTTQFVSRAAFVASSVENKEMVSPTYFTGIGGEGSSYGTILMLPPSIAYDSIEEAAFVGAGAYEPRNDTRTPAGPPTTPAGGGDG